VARCGLAVNWQPRRAFWAFGAMRSMTRVFATAAEGPPPACGDAHCQHARAYSYPRVAEAQRCTASGAYTRLKGKRPAPAHAPSQACPACLPGFPNDPSRPSSAPTPASALAAALLQAAGPHLRPSAALHVPFGTSRRGPRNTDLPQRAAAQTGLAGRRQLPPAPRPVAGGHARHPRHAALQHDGGWGGVAPRCAVAQIDL